MMAEGAAEKPLRAFLKEVLEYNRLLRREMIKLSHARVRRPMIVFSQAWDESLSGRALKSKK